MELGTKLRLAWQRLVGTAPPGRVDRDASGVAGVLAPQPPAKTGRILLPEVMADSEAGGDEFAATYLRRLQTLAKSWPGEAIGPGELLHVLNAAGSRPPLFWCFNGAGEFSRMAAELGPDQPVVGMRSLNQVAPSGPERLTLGQRLADHYTAVALAGMDFDRCAVGGNCQSGAIATRIALGFLRAGKRVEVLLNLEATPPVPFPGRVALLFGRESETHNPFFRSERPQDLWRAIHREVGWTIVPGAHGQFFEDANVGPLCAAIRDQLEASPAPPPAQGSSARLAVVLPRAREVAGSDLVLPARIGVAEGDAGGPFGILALWWSDSQGAWPKAGAETKALLRVGEAGATTLVLPTPETPGSWRLRLALCREGEGPLGGEEEDPVLEVSLEGAEVAA